jgi:hypothetical protein
LIISIHFLEEQVLAYFKSSTTGLHYFTRTMTRRSDRTLECLSDCKLAVLLTRESSQRYTAPASTGMMKVVFTKAASDSILRKVKTLSDTSSRSKSGSCRNSVNLKDYLDFTSASRPANTSGSRNEVGKSVDLRKWK